MPLTFQSALFCLLAVSGLAAGASRFEEQSAVVARAGENAFVAAAGAELDASHLESLREAASELLPRVDAGGQTAV